MRSSNYFFGLQVTVLCLLAPLMIRAQQTIQRVPVANGTDIPYLEHLPTDYQNSGKSYPLLIFLHGTGEQGNGSDDLVWKVAAHGPPHHIQEGHDMTFEVEGKKHSFIVISPQLLYEAGSWHDGYLEKVLQHVLQKYRVDASRVYLTGLSLGGGGVWRFGANQADVFAAIAPICASQSVDYGKARRIASEKLPVWAFHGNQDRTVSVNHTRGWIGLLNQYGASPTPQYAEYDGAGHGDAWQRGYRTDHQYHSLNLYEWLLTHHRGQPTTEEDPPPTPPSPAEDIWIEAECGTIGSRWRSYYGKYASGADQQFLVYPIGPKQHEASSRPEDLLTYTFDVSQGGDYHLLARIKAEDVGSNSFWVRIDDQPWVEWWEGMALSRKFTWNLMPGGGFTLSPGSHTITISYREVNTKLDKLLISQRVSIPQELGGEAPACRPDNTRWADGFRAKDLEKRPAKPSDASALAYPTPADEDLFIRLPESALPSSLSMLDITGRQLPNFKYTTAAGGALHVRTGHLPPGIYLLRWRSHGEVAMSKVLIRH